MMLNTMMKTITMMREAPSSSLDLTIVGVERLRMTRSRVAITV
jgi:hypothetical protein